ncbi:hypothetical protein MMC28_011103 [Mycoblastus sanguinarius]|nr:hypothetical protein [Mycoblastus sanguinarius]
MEVGQHRKISRPQCSQDWEDRKAAIEELYTSKPLKDTMRVMEKDHLFKATESQYKKQLRKWGLDHKRIKGPEYKAIIRKQRSREQQGLGDKSRFVLRGVEVGNSKIVGFQERNKINDEDRLSDYDNYEDQCVSTEEMREMSAVPLFQSDIETWMSNAFRRLEVTIEEGKPTKAECLLGLIVSHYLTCSDDQSLGMPSAQFREQWLPIEIAISSCHIYTITGRISDAMSMLKVVQSLIERDASQIDRFDKSHRDTLAEKCTLLRRRSYDEDVPRI